MNPGSFKSSLRSRAGNAHERTFLAVASTWSKDILLFNIPRGTRHIQSGKVIYVAKTGPDFIGCYGPAALAVEVKGATKRRLEFSQISEHQMRDLANIRAKGGHAYIAAVLPRGQVAMISWTDIASAQANGDASLGPDFLKAHIAGAGWAPT